MIKWTENYFQTDAKWFLRFKIDWNLKNLKYLLWGIFIHKNILIKSKNLYLRIRNSVTHLHVKLVIIGHILMF